VKNGNVDALYDRPKLAPQLPIEGINNILTQMDGQNQKIKMRFATEELRSYTLNLRRTLQILI
jgi:hypothetical protein